jgi:hypothetical protein
LWLGDAWARLGAHGRALAWYEKSDAAATTALEHFRAGLARAELFSRMGEHDRAERTLRALDPPDDLARMAIVDELADNDTARTRARWAFIARVVLGACFLLAIVTLRRRAGSFRAAARALWPPPLEVLYLVPVALVLGAVANTGNLLAARAVQLVLVGAVAITWLSGSSLQLARADDRSKSAIAHAFVAALATLALVYAAVMREQLLDVLVETWRSGHDMR